MNRILTINVGNYWHPNARASVAHAAKRWGCELIEIASDLGARDLFAAKFRTAQFCHPDGRCLYLDGDMLIRADAPNPFDLVPVDHMAGVVNFQGDTHNGTPEKYQRQSWAEACSQLGSRVPYDTDRYINGGFVMFSREHVPVLNRLDRTMSDTTGLNEQAGWSVMMTQTPATYLPREWNRVGNAVWQSEPRMSAYVYHFASYFGYRPNHKPAKIAAIDWKLT